ncbi:hypothetical protein Pcinc_009316 [Petrolisthes cinctipes]|uniref:Uncharacterized protein n=1 Tax=Petrolisthes cinctipes TaxID=88211 RepID=A0AAE1G773_PETCI|nr:hypothetical protein Pcinc_009316 [Petrolisthes cinctipes]
MSHVSSTTIPEVLVTPQDETATRSTEPLAPLRKGKLEHGAGIHAARNQHHHLTTQISPSKMKGSPADHLDNKFTSATSPNSYVTNSTQE